MARFLFALLIASLSPSAFALETFCQGHEELLARYLEMSEILFNGERIESRTGDYYADSFGSPDEDFRGRDSEGSEQPVVTGPERMKRVIETSKRAFPERELINDVIICNDEFVIARTHVKGVMTGPLGVYAPTGGSFEYPAIDIYRFNQQGKVFERWGVADSGRFLTQMGLLQETPGVRNPDAADGDQ